MNIRNGNTYSHNYARAAAYYLSTCAPAPDGGSRRAAYDLITGIYRVLAENPQAVGLKTLPDTSFAPWEQQKGRAKDIKTIREPIAKIEGYIAELYTSVVSGEVTENGLLLPEGVAPGKTFLKLLTAAGAVIENNPQMLIKLPAGCAEGLEELAEISSQHIIHITDGPKEDKSHLYFSRCVFDAEENWTAKAFDAVLGADGELIRLCNELEKRGYRRIDCRNGKKISLDYIKQHGKKEEPVKMAWGERTHSGIEVSYEELRLEPCFVWLRLPMFKTILENADKLPEQVRKFICDNTKTCDGCRYCVQTDKTGTRPLASVNLDGKRKCPHYPAFTMNRRELTHEFAEDILAVLDAVDALPEVK